MDTNWWMLVDDFDAFLFQTCASKSKSEVSSSQKEILRSLPPLTFLSSE